MVEDPYADTGGSEEEALTGVINVYFPEMKKWIFLYLSKAAEEVCGLVADVVSTVWVAREWLPSTQTTTCKWQRSWRCWLC